MRCRPAATFFTLLWLASGVALAYKLPGEFVLQRAAEPWKDSPGIGLLREVRSASSDAPIQEQVYLKGGRVRVETSTGARVYPTSSVSSTSSTSPASRLPHRPDVIDALFTQSIGGLIALVKDLGIAIDAVSLARLPTPAAPLPFRILYRLGSDGQRGTPQLHIEKDRWHLRRLQFREGPEHTVWYVEYLGQGERPDLPPWMPTRLEVYREGERFESITVVRRLEVPIRDSHFTLRPSGTP